MQYIAITAIARNMSINMSHILMPTRGYLWPPLTLNSLGPILSTMRIALAQINTTIGDFEGNANLVLKAMERARSEGARLLVCPELTLCGYPARDLLERRSFQEAGTRALQALARAVPDDIFVLVGFVETHGGEGAGLYNAAALLGGGSILEVRRKVLLPTYDVFDEARHFDPWPEPTAPVLIDGIPIGVTICEDIWNDREFWVLRRYSRDPVRELAASGARAIVNLSASPYCEGKPDFRREMIAAHASRHGIPVAFCNLVGGNDELIFEGGSLLIDGRGGTVSGSRRFQEDFLVGDLFGKSSAEGPAGPLVGVEEIDDIAEALTLGLKDYMRKCDFERAVVGLSGGIDSAVTAALAVRALGAGKVTGLAMPSRYSSEGSVTDARAVAENLKIAFHVVPIEDSYAAVLGTMAPLFEDTEFGVAEENIQARLRGLILMAHSNKFGGLLLTTGNKSELAVGYCTLYGDMNGGLALISDLPKTRVYELARYLNRDEKLIPESTLTKPPSAELRPDQRDQDSLPPYEILDDILNRYVEKGETLKEIVASGHDAATAHRVAQMVDRSEYKRRQAPPGLRVTSKAFGSGRRFPIAQRFEEKE